MPPTTTPRRSVEALFRPESIAVVGASPSRPSAGQPLKNLLTANYPGRVAAVNPRYDSVFEVPCFDSVENLPFTPDALAVVVNRNRVVPVIEQAAAKGVKAAVVYGMGFAESGPEGAALQARLTSVAREAGMAIVGPNCLGLINFVDSSPLFIEYLHPDYVPGRVGLIAQSGSILMSLANNRRGVHWSHIVSSGNEAVTDASDLLGFLVDDPGTDVICMFVEAIRQPEPFFAQCDRAFAAGKPIVMLKSGRSEAGATAAVAHSGALAVPDKLVDALIHRHRVLRVDSVEELLQTAIAMQSPVRPRGGRVATLAPSGAQIELVLDEVESMGLTHVPFTDTTCEMLRGLLPEYLQAKNPLDWWGLKEYRQTFPAVLKAVVDDPDIDVVVDLTDFGHGPTGRDNHHEHLDHALGLAPCPKVLAVLEGIDGAVTPDAVRKGLEQGVLVLSGIPTGYRALRHLVGFAAPPRRPAEQPSVPQQDLIARISDRDGPLGGGEGLGFLAAAGIPTVRSALVADADAAVAATSAMRFPMVVKSADAQHAHKTEIGAVRVGLRDAGAVADAARAVLALGADSLLVQEQVMGGAELILGLQTHPQLGTFVLVGMGGIWAEIVADVCIRPVGLREGEAAEMLASLRGYPLLRGARGTTPLDVGSVVEMIERLDAIGTRAGHLLEAIDINPVIVAENRAVAVDALIVPRTRLGDGR